MASLVDSLLEQLQNPDRVNQISGKLGVPPEKVNSAISAAISAIMAGLAKNTEKPDGAASLSKALDQHNGTGLDDDSYFDSYDADDGDKILGHVFGDKKPAVESQVAAFGGISGGQGEDLMKMLAPLVLGYLGKEKSAGELDVGSLSEMLGGGGSGGFRRRARTPGWPRRHSRRARRQPPASGTSGQKSPGLGGMLGKLFKKK